MKTVLVTGSSSGFGLQIVKDLLLEGHFVIATLRKAEERMDLFKDLLSEHPEKLVIKSLDVTKEKDRENIYSFLKNELGRELNVLVNNAGVGFFGSLEDMSEVQIREQMEVNFFGSTFLTRKLMPLLRESRGKVINISSLMGRYSSPLGAVYSASKYALEGLSEGLKYELAPFGVEVTTLAPGGHRTNFIKGLVWGDRSDDPESPYFFQSEALRRLMEKLTSREKAPGPTNISKVVISLVKKTKTPRRIMIGRDAIGVSFIQKILPERLYHNLMMLGHRLVFRNQNGN